jgi:hypothetical protein
MPDWIVGLPWLDIAAGIVGAAGLIVAILANKHSRQANRHAEEATAAAKEANRIAEQANEISAKALAIAEDQSKVKIRVEPEIAREFNTDQAGVKTETSWLVLYVINEGVECEIADAGLCFPSGKGFYKPFRYRNWPHRLASKSRMKIEIGWKSVQDEWDDKGKSLPRLSVAGAATVCGARIEVGDHPKVIQWIQESMSHLSKSA